MAVRQAVFHVQLRRVADLKGGYGYAGRVCTHVAACPPPSHSIGSNQSSNSTSCNQHLAINTQAIWRLQVLQAFIHHYQANRLHADLRARPSQSTSQRRKLQTTRPSRRTLPRTTSSQIRSSAPATLTLTRPRPRPHRLPSSPSISWTRYPGAEATLRTTRAWMACGREISGSRGRARL